MNAQQPPILQHTPLALAVLIGALSGLGGYFLGAATTTPAQPPMPASVLVQTVLARYPVIGPRELLCVVLKPGPAETVHVQETLYDAAGDIAMRRDMDLDAPISALFDY